MRQIMVNVPANAPAKFALAYAYTYFLDRERERDRDPARSALQLTLRARAAVISADVPVRVRVQYQAGDGKESASILIAWQADEHATSFPTFRGTLRAVETQPSTCELALSGFYSPPGGAAGAAFDAVLGVRIAHASIEKLLHGVAEGAARDYETRLAL